MDVYNIAINVTYSRQCSNILLFGTTRLRLSHKWIKNHLFMLKQRLKKLINSEPIEKITLMNLTPHRIRKSLIFLLYTLPCCFSLFMFFFYFSFSFLTFSPFFFFLVSKIIIYFDKDKQKEFGLKKCLYFLATIGLHFVLSCSKK